jgi:hypothetical protein
VFVALDDIYLFDTVNGPQPIGGMAKKSIFADLELRSDYATARVIGKLPGGADYLTYWLSIPQSGNSKTVVWIYHADDRSWVRETFSYGDAQLIYDVAVA